MHCRILCIELEEEGLQYASKNEEQVSYKHVRRGPEVLEKSAAHGPRNFTCC